MIHRLETNKLRNIAKFFAHLLHSDALPWGVMEYLVITEEETTSSSRIFIKVLFQEVAEYMGLRGLRERLTEPHMQPSFLGLFPKDSAKNTRFAINFWTAIGLGGITDGMREHLQNAPKRIMAAAEAALQAAANDEVRDVPSPSARCPDWNRPRLCLPPGLLPTGP